ncbi:MAG: hypothetical protein ACO3FE_03030, partial [Planctomycetaceae bacterium]
VVRRRTKFDQLRVSPRDLWDHYNKHKESFKIPELFTVQIVLPNMRGCWITFRMPRSPPV